MEHAAPQAEQLPMAMPFRRPRSALNEGPGPLAMGQNADEEEQLGTRSIPADYDKWQRPAPGGNASTPTAVRVGVSLLRVISIDATTQSFDYEVVMTTQWRDARLRTESAAGARVGPHSIWAPALRVSNIYRQTEWIADRAYVSRDGVITRTRRGIVHCYEQFQLRHYPFDRHELKVYIESFAYGSDQVRLQVDTEQSRWVDRADQSVWSLQDWTVGAETSDVSDSGHRQKTDFVVCELHIRRIATRVVATIVLPLIMIVCFTFSSFWVEASALQDRLVITTIGFLTVMAFMYCILEELPKIAYLTWLQLYMIMCFFFTLAMQAHIIVVHYMAPMEDTSNMRRRARLLNGQGTTGRAKRPRGADAEGGRPSFERLRPASPTLAEDPNLVAVSAKAEHLFELVNFGNDGTISIDDVVFMHDKLRTPISSKDALEMILGATNGAANQISYDAFVSVLERHKDLVVEGSELGDSSTSKAMKIDSDTSPDRAFVAAVMKFDGRHRKKLRRKAMIRARAERIDRNCRIWLPLVFCVATAAMIGVELPQILHGAYTKPSQLEAGDV